LSRFEEKKVEKFFYILSGRQKLLLAAHNVGAAISCRSDKNKAGFEDSEKRAEFAVLKHWFIARDVVIKDSALWRGIFLMVYFQEISELHPGSFLLVRKCAADHVRKVSGTA
jgi:hypothetical protein